MAADRASYLGPKLRRLRRDLGLTQPGMAADLGVSVSYISLIESNQRPVTADMLLRLARTYRLDLAQFAGDGGALLSERLRSGLQDPLFADIDLPPLQIADVATNYPGVAEAFLRLQTAYREEQLTLAEQRTDPAADDSERRGHGIEYVAEVRRHLAAHRNNFPALDDAGALFSARIAEHGGAEDYLAARHALRVRTLFGDRENAGALRRYDRHHGAVFLDETLDAASRAFQLALQIVYLELAEMLDALVAQAEHRNENFRRLLRRGLAGYAAAAIRMPYDAIRRAAEERGYDLEALARRFGASVEQVAHRLTSLQRPGNEGVSFFFMRIDPAGNVSKRLDGAGFPFPGYGGACPLWSVHDAFRNPGQVVTQWLQMPDDRIFFSAARTVTAGGGAFGAPRIERAIALVCAAQDAGRLVYASGEQTPRDATPVGITCSLCQREACPARALPPIGRQILPDDNYRRLAPFGFGGD